MMHFQQTLLSQQNLSPLKLLRCAGAEQLSRVSYLLQRQADDLGNVACCLSVRAALDEDRIEEVKVFKYHGALIVAGSRAFRERSVVKSVGRE